MNENVISDVVLDPTFHNGSVNSALTRIKNSLNFSLKDRYGIEDEVITEKFMKMHGLSKDHFDFINNFEALIEKGIADNSVDTNANKGATSITGFFAETAMPINKLVGYRYLYRKMKEMYGKKRAKYLSGLMYDMSLALADSANIMKPYCFAVNASRLVIDGKPWGTLPSLPPKHVQSYITNLTEAIHQLSNHTAGALAVGSFFLDIAKVMIYRDHKTLTDIKNDPYWRKNVENSLQSFIHSMNHLSRNSIESPFTNISIFDRTKILALIADDNMGWYFEKDDPIDGVPVEAIADCGDRDWKNYIADIILEIEDIYMDIMDAGDKCHDGRPITFPVSTINLSREEKDGKYIFSNPEFVDHVCKNHDIMRYNIYISEGMKVASCCFSPDTELNFYDEEGNPVSMSIGDFVETRLPNHSEKLVTDVHAKLSGKETIRGMHGTIIPITGVSKLINHWKRMIKVTFVGGDHIWVTPDQVFVLRNEEQIEAKDLIPGSLLYKEVEVAAVDTYDSDDYVYDIEVGSDDHLFKLRLPKCGKNISVSNCRLINDNELFELGGAVNSFGGNALSLGSHRVVTLNLRRIALECESWEDYKNILHERMDSAADILIAHRALLKDLIARGTQPFLSTSDLPEGVELPPEAGWLDLDRMFSTFGILGYYEAAKDLTKRFGDDIDYLGAIVSDIDAYSRQLSIERKNIFNVEEIPGETMAVKLSNCDRWIYGEEKVPEKIYTNQFVPLWEDVTLYEKFHREGYLASQLTGGGIIHYSLGEKVTSKQARKVIDMAMTEGAEHFALNPTYAICANDHFTLGKYETCPKCGAPIVDNLTRTIGFFCRTSNMTTTKREEDYEKRHYKGVEE